MAKGSGENVGNLYLRLGLSYDELNQDFVNVEETLSSNIQRLNRQNTMINLKAAIDLTGVTDAAQKLKIQQEALTRQVEIQQQKVKLYETEWIAAGKANGSASVQAEKAAIALKRQQLELANLTQRLKDVQAAQSSLPKADNSLLAGYKGLKGNVSGELNNLISTFTGIKDSTSSADAAITKSLEIIGNIPSTAGKAVAALATIPLVMKGIENSLLNMAKPAIEAGDAMYVMSRGMQLSIADAAKLSTVAKVTGIEISEVNGAMRRLSASLNKAGDKDNAAMQMLTRFGAEVKDSSGNIKNEIELIEEVSKALKRAEAEGQGAAFRDIVGGRFWSGDFVTFLEDYADNVDAASNIVKNGLANPALAHQVQGNINAMNTQMGQFQSALSSAFMPAAENLIPQLTKQFGELTKVIADNAEGIKNVSMALGEVVGGVSSLTTEIIKLGIESTRLMKKVPTSAIIDKYKDDYAIHNARDLTDRILQDNYNDAERYTIQTSPRLYSAMIKQNEEAFQGIKKLQEETKKATRSWADFRNETDKKINISAALDDSLKRVEKFSNELEHLKIDLSFGKDDYGKQLAELDLWYGKALESAKGFDNEIKILTELRNAKLAQIDRAHNEKIEESRKESAQRTKDLLQEAYNIDFNRTHSPFEQQINNIRQWEQQALESLSRYKDAIADKNRYEQETAAITANALAKEREAYEREIDRIRGKTQDLYEKIFEQEHSRRDIDIMRAQKERDALIKEGIFDSATIERWYQNELSKIRENVLRGGADYTKTPDLPRGNNPDGFNVMYGNGLGDLPNSNFFGEIQNETSNAMEKFGALTESTQNLTTAQDELAKSFELIEGDKIVSAFNESVNGVIDAQSNLTDAVNQEGDNLAKALQETAQVIRDTQNRLQVPPTSTSQGGDSVINADAAKTAADIVGTIGEAVALAGAVTLNPALAAGGGAVAFAGNTASKAFENMDTSTPTNYPMPNVDNSEIISAIQDAQDKIAGLLDELSKHTAEIAQNVQSISQDKQPPPNITVSPNINIDLGGAYVFDNTLKKQLTDDIANDVADAVKDAVQSATSAGNFGYSN